MANKSGHVSPEDLAIMLSNQCIERNELDGAMRIVLAAMEIVPNSPKLREKRHEIFEKMRIQGVAPEFRVINKYVIHFFPEKTEIDASLLAPSKEEKKPQDNIHVINYDEWCQLRGNPKMHREETPMVYDEKPTPLGTSSSMDTTRKRDARRIRKEIERYARESSRNSAVFLQKYFAVITDVKVDLGFHNIGGEIVFPDGTWEVGIKEFLQPDAGQKFLQQLHSILNILDYRSRPLDLLDPTSGEIRCRDALYFQLLYENHQRPSGMDERLRKYAQYLRGAVLLVFPIYATLDAFHQPKKQ